MQYPSHVGFIPDGNRTWARQKGLPEHEGYRHGMKKAFLIVRHLLKTTPISTITGRFLSTENVKQRQGSVLETLMRLVRHEFGTYDRLLRETQVSFDWVGSSVGLPDDFVSWLNEKKQALQYNSGRTVIFAVNYGGQDEIVRASKKILAAGLRPDEVTAQLFHQYTDFAAYPPFDLIIRTKGDTCPRLSGFASWSGGYAQLYFSDRLCPDFSVDDCDEVMKRYDEHTTGINFGK
ncbi:MAG: polyprenyl diphosphate synthase [Candidatus Absconditabacterales bacterium]|nr:polyprenyl diphosphate synthase [Candidatus Absconditabacterales bacterium]